jgi:NADH-quinone oxidoreductase subunit J
MGAWILFIVLSVVLVGAALMVVSARDLVHTVLWLALGLVTTAGVHVALAADFLAAVQILLYSGGVVTLMLFAVMLTRHLEGATARMAPERGARGAVVAVLLAGLVGASVWGSKKLGARAPEMEVDTAALGRLFLGELVLPFELLSVLLLAAMIGAIVLSRADGPPGTIPRLPPRVSPPPVAPPGGGHD